MRRYRTRFLVTFLVIAIACALKTEPVRAQYEPPAHVTLNVYRLVEGSGAIYINPATGERVPCTKNEEMIAQSYGCTADPGNPIRAYPFNSSTITIGIDGTGGPDNAQYPYPYLWDIVPQELDLNGSQGNKPLSSVEAQAIASRTYIYQRILYPDDYDPINNSTQFQVFLPYRYVDLTGVQQDRVRDATANRHYMTESNGAYPIEALFGADNPEYTVEGNRPYLKRVYDPINSAYGVSNGTTLGGMSSKGASRWSFGHISSLGPVAEEDEKYPNDVNGLGNFWSVQWDKVEQILTHYYTGIHIRDADRNIATPNRRWVPLDIFSFSSPSDSLLLCEGQTHYVAVQLQNTGIYNWGENAFALSYRPSWSSGSTQSIAADPIFITPTPAGEAATTVVPIKTLDYVGQGSYTIGLDMQAYSTPNPGDFQWFSDQGWPWYEVKAEVIDNCQQVYLPLLQNGATVGAAD